MKKRSEYKRNSTFDGITFKELEKGTHGHEDFMNSFYNLRGVSLNDIENIETICNLLNKTEDTCLYTDGNTCYYTIDPEGFLNFLEVIYYNWHPLVDIFSDDLKVAIYEYSNNIVSYMQGNSESDGGTINDFTVTRINDIWAEVKVNYK